MAWLAWFFCGVCQRGVSAKKTPTKLALVLDLGRIVRERVRQDPAFSEGRRWDVGNILVGSAEAGVSEG